MERPSCATCWYYEANPKKNPLDRPDLNPVPFGECHRKSPAASRFFPNVLPDDWCGEHNSMVKWCLDQGVKEKQSCESASLEGQSTTKSSTDQAG